MTLTFEHYSHHFIFRNLTTTSVMGCSFHVQRFEPTTLALTTVRSRIMGINQCDDSGHQGYNSYYADEHAFTHKCFAHGDGICTKAQAGLESALRLAVLAEGLEDRVRHFQNAYLASTGKKNRCRSIYLGYQNPIMYGSLLVRTSRPSYRW